MKNNEVLTVKEVIDSVIYSGKFEEIEKESKSRNMKIEFVLTSDIFGDFKVPYHDKEKFYEYLDESFVSMFLNCHVEKFAIQNVAVIEPSESSQGLCGNDFLSDNFEETYTYEITF